MYACIYKRMYIGVSFSTCCNDYSTLLFGSLRLFVNTNECCILAPSFTSHIHSIHHSLSLAVTLCFHGFVCVPHRNDWTKNNIAPRESLLFTSLGDVRLNRCSSTPLEWPQWKVIPSLSLALSLHLPRSVPLFRMLFFEQHSAYSLCSLLFTHNETTRTTITRFIVLSFSNPFDAPEWGVRLKHVVFLNSISRLLFPPLFSRLLIPSLFSRLLFPLLFSKLLLRS